MAEMILPGTFIEVRPEGLIVPGRVSVGNLGVVGTASRGEIGKPTILSSYTEARDVFGDYDAWEEGGNNSLKLTLNRALEQSFRHGARVVFAVRVASAAKAKAQYTLNSTNGPNVFLSAKSEGAWGNELEVNVFDAEEDAFIEDEGHSGGAGINLNRTPVVESARNRIRLLTDADGLTRSLQILYDNNPALPSSGQVKVDRTSGQLQFPAGEEPAAADILTASYLVDRGSAVKVTLRLGLAEEVYTAVDGNDLAGNVNRLSAWVDANPLANAAELPTKNGAAEDFPAFIGGRNGEDASTADFEEGLRKLTDEPAHIIVAAGRDTAGFGDQFGDELDAHVQTASSDAVKRDRIAVVGSRLGASLDDLRGHTLNSDRVIFVAPGIKSTDAPTGNEVTLPGAYAAAAVAGLISSFSAHISPTNKTLRVGGLETRFTRGQLKQLVLSRILVLEERQGFRIVKGITTSTNTAFHQVTTRRIVDFAKAGVRSAANPYIGLLNNERVRAAMQATINSFFQQMVNDEMLISYELEVTATRDEERQGIARVTIVLRPAFSIDFIKVTMFLE